MRPRRITPAPTGHRSRNRLSRQLNVRQRPVRSTAPEPARLLELASRLGVQTSYSDMAGETQTASPETVRAILQAWGVPAETASDLRDAIHEQRQRERLQVLPPVMVVWDGAPLGLNVRLPAKGANGRGNCRLHFEDGRIRSIDWPAQTPVRAGAAAREPSPSLARVVRLPELPFGYHHLELEFDGRRHECLLVSAPTRSYSPPGGGRAWGVFLPLYAAHSDRSWGAGNLTDFRKLAEWTGDLGGGVIATLPLLAAFLDAPLCEPSPYSPVSRLLWNEFYLDLEAVPEFSSCAKAQKIFRSAGFQERLAGFRSAPLVEYREQMAARRQVLEPMAAAFFASGAARSQSYQRFLQERPAVRSYAEFRAVGERLQQPWSQWAERLQRGKIQPDDYAADARDYHLYVQWLVQEQMSGLIDACRARGVQFYLDLPLGVHPDGYDVWRERDVFTVSARTGAPPDLFFTKGQDWGFPPLHPERLRQSGYGYVLEYLRFHMRHTGLLRIDHIMGLHRLYWIPAGFPPSHGAYVSYPAAELHALLCLESHRHQTVLAGENLGTVPPEVNAAMARHDLRETYVVQYEQRPNPNRPLRRPLPRSVASLNTHDMPTFAAHWRGLDIADRAQLGLVPAGRVREHQARRAKLGSALAAFLKRKGFLKSSRAGARAVLQACLEWLGAGPSELVLVNLEDLWQEERPQNVPGTCTERPNWRRQARFPLEQIIASPALRRILRRLAQTRAGSAPRKSRSPAGAKPDLNARA